MKSSDEYINEILKIAYERSEGIVTYKFVPYELLIEILKKEGNEDRFDSLTRDINLGCRDLDSKGILIKGDNTTYYKDKENRNGGCGTNYYSIKDRENKDLLIAIGIKPENYEFQQIKLMKESIEVYKEQVDVAKTSSSRSFAVSIISIIISGGSLIVAFVALLK